MSELVRLCGKEAVRSEIRSQRSENLLEWAFEDGDDVSGSALEEIRIENADEFPALVAKAVQGIIELLSIQLAAAEKPTGGLEHDGSVFPFHIAECGGGVKVGELRKWEGFVRAR